MVNTGFEEFSVTQCSSKITSTGIAKPSKTASSHLLVFVQVGLTTQLEGVAWLLAVNKDHLSTATIRTRYRDTIGFCGPCSCCSFAESIQVLLSLLSID
jgi:hypothetical protein